tara:strand:+ start:139 stop:828 length:690 start_codon:yes stop_codon:yes gene_type:complete
MNTDPIRNAIIDDLLTKRPTGPAGQGYISYDNKEIYDVDANKYRSVVVSTNVDNFGYSGKDLFDLNLHSFHEVEMYIAKRFYDCGPYDLVRGKKIAAKRKSYRLWNRLKAPVEETKKAGGVGIYSVNHRWRSGLLGHLVADDAESARSMAKMFYSFLVEDDDRLDVTFVRSGDHTLLRSLNQSVLDSMRSDIERSERDIKRAKEKIAQKERMIEVITIVECGQLSVCEG